MNKSKKEDFNPVNSRIRAKKVRVIDKDNNNIGVLNIYDAIAMAQADSLDLVQVSQGDLDPVCKIIDYGKFKYEKSKRDKAVAKKRRESESKVKEVKLRPSTDINDLKIKSSKTIDFFNDGHKVKVSIQFKGREMSHKEVGMETLNKFLSLIPNVEVISEPSMQGRSLFAMLSRGKNDNNE